MVQNKVSDAIKRAAVSAAVDKFLDASHEERLKTYLRIVNLAQKYWGGGFTDEQYDSMRKRIKNPDSKWMKYVNLVLDETNHNFAKMTIMNLGYDAFLNGTRQIRKNREIYKCNIPWLILFDPTDACNMHCKGCWSGTYGHKHSLSYEDMDKIVTQGREIGVYLYMLTGGEPTVKMDDILKLAEQHHDCYFALYTNSTLITDELCKKIVKLGNITFMVSIEGTEQTNDARRGSGHYQTVLHAMDLLHKYGIFYGTSVCYTSQNVEAVTSDEFFQVLVDHGARFGFYFHYMPVGNNAVPSLMPNPDQRQYMIKRIREIRSQTNPIMFYPMDFQNDGEYVGGCIAGGRNYFHINAAGDAEPCVFIHFSNANIHDSSILEILKSPLFMAYHEGQPFNRNHLRPCPMLENPEYLREMVKKTGAHGTNLESEESVDHLCDKCEDYAARWKPVADKIWAEEPHRQETYQNYAPERRTVENHIQA